MSNQKKNFTRPSDPDDLDLKEKLGGGGGSGGVFLNLPCNIGLKTLFYRENYFTCTAGVHALLPGAEHVVHDTARGQVSLLVVL